MAHCTLPQYWEDSASGSRAAAHCTLPHHWEDTVAGLEGRASPHTLTPSMGKALSPASKAVKHNTHTPPLFGRRCRWPRGPCGSTHSPPSRGKHCPRGPCGSTYPPSSRGRRCHRPCRPSSTTCVFQYWRRLSPSSMWMPTKAVTTRHWQGVSSHALPSSQKLPRSWPRSPSMWRAWHSTSHPSLLESSRWHARHSTSSCLPTGVNVVHLVGRMVHRSVLPLNIG